MARWAITEVFLREQGKHPLVRTTEPAIVDELFGELKAVIPSASMRRSKAYEILGVWDVYFEDLNDKDFEVIWWLLARLGRGVGSRSRPPRERLASSIRSGGTPVASRRASARLREVVRIGLLVHPPSC